LTPPLKPTDEGGRRATGNWEKKTLPIKTKRLYRGAPPT